MFLFDCCCGRRAGYVRDVLSSKLLARSAGMALDLSLLDNRQRNREQCRLIWLVGVRHFLFLGRPGALVPSSSARFSRPQPQNRKPCFMCDWITCPVRSARCWRGAVSCRSRPPQHGCPHSLSSAFFFMLYARPILTTKCRSTMSLYSSSMFASVCCYLSSSLGLPPSPL